ncbi:MAG TPA: NAD(P)-dependent oxidoreductase, partial [Anseongella sp.]
LRSLPQLLEALPEAHILIDTLPATGETQGFISSTVLDAMRSESIFVNIGRGNTVVEPALVNALRTRKIGGAVLDVYALEPLPADNPLWVLPNVIITQHTGGGFADEQKYKISFFLKNLHRVLQNETPLNLVDLQKGY